MKTLLAALLLLCFSTNGFSQYPSKPIKFIVGFPPGGSADPTTRIIGQALSEQLGQPVVVDNRPGADSALAAEQVTRIEPDGYTIMFASNSAMTAAVALRKEPRYDPLKDFTPISMVGRATVFFYVNPDVPAKNMREFIAYAKANPGKLAYGTGNPLSILYNVQLMGATGIDMLHVPYKGEGPLNRMWRISSPALAVSTPSAAMSGAAETSSRVSSSRRSAASSSSSSLSSSAVAARRSSGPAIPRLLRSIRLRYDAEIPMRRDISACVTPMARRRSRMRVPRMDLGILLAPFLALRSPSVNDLQIASSRDQIID